MQVLKTIKFIIIFGLIFSSCYYDVEEEIYQTVDCLTDNLSYTNDILPIIEADCYACHTTAANFGNVSLEGHSNLLKYVEDGSLVGVISHANGYSPMPQGGAKLLDCEIEKIVTWISDGAPNN